MFLSVRKKNTFPLGIWCLMWFGIRFVASGLTSGHQLACILLCKQRECERKTGLQCYNIPFDYWQRHKTPMAIERVWNNSGKTRKQYMYVCFYMGNRKSLIDMNKGRLYLVSTKAHLNQSFSEFQLHYIQSRHYLFAFKRTQFSLLSI